MALSFKNGESTVRRTAMKLPGCQGSHDMPTPEALRPYGVHKVRVTETDEHDVIYRSRPSTCLRTRRAAKPP